MSHNDTKQYNDDFVQREISLLRHEVAQVHREMLCALQCISEILSELKMVEGSQERSAQRLEGLLQSARSRTAPAETQLCHVCAGPLEKHHAPAGDLLICRACGWSEFIDRTGAELNETRPEDVPRECNRNLWAV